MRNTHKATISPLYYNDCNSTYISHLINIDRYASSRLHMAKRQLKKPESRGYTRVNSGNYLSFENNRERADDSHHKVSHAFTANGKIGNVVRHDFLCFQEHRTLNKRLLGGSRESCRSFCLLRRKLWLDEEQRGGMQIGPGAPSSSACYRVWWALLYFEWPLKSLREKAYYFGQWSSCAPAGIWTDAALCRGCHIMRM